MSAPDPVFQAELDTAQALAWANLKSRLSPETAAALSDTHRALYCGAFCEGELWLMNQSAVKA